MRDEKKLRICKKCLQFCQEADKLQLLYAVMAELVDAQR